MSSAIKSLMGLVTPELITKASSLLGEREDHVIGAAKSTIGSLIGGLLSKKDVPGLDLLLKKVADHNMVSNLSSISSVSNMLSGTVDEASKSITHELTNTLFGNKFADVVNMVSSDSGISLGNAGKLFSALSPLVLGFLGKQLKEGLGFNQLISNLLADKDALKGLLPKGFDKIADLSTLAGIKNTAVDPVAKAVQSELYNGKSFPWLKVALPVLAALIGGYYLFSNSNKNTIDVVQVKNEAREHSPQFGQRIDLISKDVKEAATEVKEQVDQIQSDLHEIAGTVGSQADKIVDDAKTAVSKTKDMAQNLVDDARMATIETIQVKLPGTDIVLSGLKDGIEMKMLEFIQDDNIAMLSDDELKNTWFDFDNINFEFGSGTQITKDSEAQINNVAAILKHYPDISVKIGAYTDKKGDEQLNLQLSNKRAETIKRLLIEHGVSEAQIAGTEGYGSEFATVSVNASDAERKKDRRVALRFERKL